MGKNALGYNPASYKKRTQGVATIKKGTDMARITWMPNSKGETPEFDDRETSKKFKASELPRLPVIPTNTQDDYFVKLNGDGEIESISPANGTFIAVVSDMSRPEKEADPAPYPINPNDEKIPPYRAFNVYWKILDGDFKNCTVNQFLKYDGGEQKQYFAESIDNPGFTNWGMPVTQKAIWLPKLQEFCEVTGCVEEALPFPDDGNVLPELLTRCLADKKKVQLIIKNGYVDSLLPVGGGRKTIKAEDLDEDEPVKKPTSKGKKPVAKSKSKHASDDDL